MVHPEILKELAFFRALKKPVLELVAEHAEIREYTNNEIISTQHNRAIALFILLSGTVQFLIRIEGGEDLLVGVGRERGLIVGWAAFRAPFRYTTTVRCEQCCRFLRVPHHVFDEIMAADEASGLLLLRRVAESMAHRLDFERERLMEAASHSAARGTPPIDSRPPPSAGESVAPVDAPSTQEQMVEFLAHTHFFEGMEERFLQWLADQAFVANAERGTTLFEEGRVSEHLYLIIDGKIGFTYGDQPDTKQLFLRTISGTGEPLGWSALVDPRRYHDTCVVLKTARLVALPSLPLERLCEENPAFGIALFKRVLQVIGSRLRAIRVGLVVRRYTKETLAVRTLLDQSAESLHVSSALHKIPYLLENRLTLSDAFHVLELTQSHGDSLERHLAALSLDLLEGVHRELDFYRGLQAAYETVANAPKELAAEEVRKWGMRVFVEVFKKTNHRIRGEENLPEQPGCILIMNHLDNHPDTQLPNDFRLTLDSHFVSSMILYRRYDDAPIRVIRKPPLGWYGHQQYFDRLDYIYVYAGEMDEEDRDQHLTHGDRILSFLERAGAHLQAGRNVVIAPEGSCRQTENSPGPFKPGAFRLAASVHPEPLIIPVAVANFDKKITHTTTASIVYPPFRLSDRVSDPSDQEALAAFLEELQREYEGYVREAIALAES